MKHLFSVSTKPAAGQDVLSGREVSKPAVGMDFVLVVHPFLDLAKSGCGVRNRTDAHVIALEGFREGLSHSVALGAFDRCEAGSEAESQRDLYGRGCGINRTVVGQPFEAMRSAHCPEASFDRFDHHVADHLARDAARGSPSSR